MCKEDKSKYALVLVAIILLFSSLLFASCSNRQKLKVLESRELGVDVAMADYVAPASVRDSLLEQAPQDRVAVVDIQGKVLIMDAVKDDETGEMVITERIKAVVVEAKFRNIAERNGFVDIAFDVKVPKVMQSSDWQVRLSPRLYFLGDTLNLDRILITGERYRASQLKGYELYNKFLSSIIPDTCSFLHRNLLEIFVGRHFKELAALKSDTSYVDNSLVENVFGVTLQQTMEHYTNNLLVNRNNRKKGRIGKMYSKYIKAPLDNYGVKLDTVISDKDSMLIYRYTHRLKTRKGLRKVDMVIDGGIFLSNKKIYTIPQSEPLTYYISSMTFFADTSVKYLKQIISRNAVANTAAYIDFKAGDYNLCDTLHENKRELLRIKNNIAALMQDKDYIIDSLNITASCSPEGSYKANEILSGKRAKSIKDYFVNYMKWYSDSVNSSYWELDFNGAEVVEEAVPMAANDIEKLVNITSVPENWNQLAKILYSDTTIKDKTSIDRIMCIDNLDEREKALGKIEDYKYVRSVIYPLLRTVRFDFYLHRKGMIKDTIHTTVVDSEYMRGVAALAAHNYEEAVTVLRPYEDMNAALAYICMDYNNSALAILEKLPKSAKRDYLLAIVWGRLGDEQMGVEYFLHAVSQDYSMRHRGNLDPEISVLISKYNVNQLIDENINQF